MQVGLCTAETTHKSLAPSQTRGQKLKLRHIKLRDRLPQSCQELSKVVYLVIEVHNQQIFQNAFLLLDFTLEWF